MKNNYHESVMVSEVVDSLHILKGKKYIDATLGTGGHAIEIAKLGGKVIGIDFDPEMLAIAKERIVGNKNITLVQGNFIEIDKIAKENNFPKVSGILYDLGVSNIHLKDQNRGFSFDNPNANLDMRLNPKSQGVKASDLLNILREDHLIKLFNTVMELGPSKWLTKRVLEERNLKPFKNVGDFLRVTEGIRGKIGLNPATLPLLALRIAVNSELDNLKQSLGKAYELLEKGGVLVVISFHSGEDQIVKKFINSILKEKKEYQAPTLKEIKENPRARSARLRILQK